MCAFRFLSACSNVCFLVPFGMLQGYPKSITVDIFMFQGALGQSAWTERSSYKNKCFVACFFIVGFSVLILQCSELVSDARCSSNTYCTASAYLQLRYISSSPLYVFHSWLGIFERPGKLHRAAFEVYSMPQSGHNFYIISLLDTVLPLLVVQISYLLSPYRSCCLQGC